MFLYIVYYSLQYLFCLFFFFYVYFFFFFYLIVFFFFFFFQAEDGIRDDLVTGVQTCALPISSEPMKCKWLWSTSFRFSSELFPLSKTSVRWRTSWDKERQRSNNCSATLRNVTES